MRTTLLKLRCENYVVGTTLLELRCENYVVGTALLELRCENYVVGTAMWELRCGNIFQSIGLSEDVNLLLFLARGAFLYVY